MYWSLTRSGAIREQDENAIPLHKKVANSNLNSPTHLTSIRQELGELVRVEPSSCSVLAPILLVASKYLK